MLAGEDNLIPMSERTKDEQRKIATMGGIASGESRRQRKAMKEQAELLLSLPFKDRVDENGESLLSYYKQMSGIDDTEDIDNQMAMLIAMFNNALSGGKNSVQAFTALRDIVGEKPKEVIEVQNTDKTIQELQQMVKDKQKGEQ